MVALLLLHKQAHDKRGIAGAHMHAVMLSKKHRWSNPVQQKELTNEGRPHLLLLHKQAHDKKALQNHCKQAYIYRAKLTAKLIKLHTGEVENYHNSSKIHPPLSLRSRFIPLSSSPMDLFSGD